MRFLSLIAAGLFCAASLHAADATPLAKAQSLLRHGKWEDSRAAFESLLKDDKTRSIAVAGIAESYRAVGDFEKALDVLAKARKVGDNPDLQAAEGDLLFSLGRWDEAVERANAALVKDKNHFLARWVKARVLRDKGDLKAADPEIRWFVREYTRASNEDKEIKDPEKLLIVGLAATENARWRGISDQFRFILNELYTDLLKANPEVWQAEYQAGMLLLEKYNRPEAMEAFDNAIKINPQAAVAHAGKGMIALQIYELKDAETYADRALKINPKLNAALCVKADVLMIGDDIAGAAKWLEKAIAVNPRDEEALGRLAACAFLLKQQDKFNQLVLLAESFTAKPVHFYSRLAQALEERKLYKVAEEYYRKAIACGTQFPGPPAHLAMLDLRLGKETEARALLNTSFDSDRFNVRVSNMIKVLKHLDKYEKIETKHYEVRFDPKTDKVLAEFVADYLEEIHRKLTVDFGDEPKERILFELFNSHEMFSGRTVGVPDLHTIGACTGTVVTMASPRAKGLNKPFNWGRVLRHELVHVFNLAQTEFKVPHWLTEGLAVRNEGFARPHAWSRELRRSYEANSLLNLDTIMLGFVRPRSPDEWMLAYCQSQLYVEYLVSRFGADKIGRMLAAYRDGLDTAQAIQKVCGVGKMDFETGYKEFLKKAVAEIPALAMKREAEMTVDELEDARDKSPDDLDIAAKLAEQYQKRERPAESRKLVETVLKKKPDHPLALLVKSRLLQAAGDTDSAKATLEAALKDNPNDFGLLQALIKALRDGDDTEKAIELLEKARKSAPLDGDWLTQLTEIYTARMDLDKLADVLREKIAYDADDLDGRLQLGRLYLDAKKFDDAEKVGKEALQIDVLNPEAQRIVLTALKELDKQVELKKLEKRFGMVAENP